MASSSSSSMQQKPLVFLSFRGEDTRDNFTSHLYAALKRKGIDTFIDNQLVRGEEISSALWTTIEQSQISVIVLSKNYASSSFCLDELSKILECKERNGQMVVPIFYHVDPSDIRNLKGAFAEAFAEHDKKRANKVEGWSVVLKKVADLAGYHLDAKKNRLESTVVEEIAKKISKKLKYKSLYDTKCLVGMDSHITRIKSLLHIDSSDVQVIGICGIGGIGKTTIAEAVYNQFSAEFDGCCFLNVKTELKYGGVHILKKLLSDVLEDENLNIDTSSLPAPIYDRLHHKKVFVVLDDVNNLEELDLLRGKHFFGLGSRIIITSRDKQVLRQVVKEIYEVEGLIDVEALQLFSVYAFKQSHPKEDFMELSKKVVDYAKGLPLALKVLGSTLYGKSKLDWEGDLSRLKVIPNPKIDDVLRISYDGLDHEVKNIFLDISCFFKGEGKDYVTKILSGCYISIMSGISDLVDKSLITILDNKLEMHDLLQQMAWNIVCQESKRPEKRSRLWTHEDIYHVLKNNKDAEIVEGMSLDMSKVRKLRLSSMAFAGMCNLRLLNFYYSDRTSERKVYLPRRGLESLPDNLRYLRWDVYPAKSLPSNFCPENLINLKMRNNHVKRLWQGTQDLGNLKWLDLNFSKHLIELPDLSRATNLEEMRLWGCKSLVEVPSNINLRSLKHLDLIGCLKLTKFPEISENLGSLCLAGTAIAEVPSSIECLFKLEALYMRDCIRLERLPSSICKLKSLLKLNLNCCLKLKSFPEILEPMECLEELHLNSTLIEELPSSIEHLVGLEELQLKNCEKLKNLPSSIRKLKSLKRLSVKNCSNFTQFPDIPENLELLDLDGTAIEEVPSLIGCFSKLKVYLTNCTRLERLPSSICKLKSLRNLDLSGCLKLKSFPEILEPMECLKRLHLNSTSIEVLPSSIEHLVGLEELQLHDCENLKNLPSSIRKLKSLKNLTVRNCSNFTELSEIPENLELLDLGGTAIEQVSSSIKQLWKLRSLDLSYCKRLQSIPELPPNLKQLNATSCTSLEAVSSSFTILLNTEESNFKFTDCVKLDQNAITHILAESRLSIQHMETEALKLYHEGKVSFGICLPGSEILEWFSCQRTGSSLTIQLAGFALCAVVGFALCAVVALEDYDESNYFRVRCKYNFKTDNGAHDAGDCILYTSKGSFDSDNVFLYCKLCVPIHSNEASFEFYVSYWGSATHCGKVKKCGVHLLYAQNDPTINQRLHDKVSIRNFRSDEVEEEPQPKRLKWN